MNKIHNILNLILIGLLIFDMVYWTPRKIEKARDDGYSKAMTEAKDMLDSATTAIVNQDTSVGMYIEGKDTSYTIYYTH